MNKEVRWQQRFQNLEKAFAQLEKSVRIVTLSDTERAGMIQFFELTFELAWKTLKDFLESQGFQVKTPRETLKQAYQIDLIKDGQLWMQALEDRNLTSHTYDEATSLKVEHLIRENYFPLLKNLVQTLNSKKDL